MGKEHETDGWLKIFAIVIGNRPCYTTYKMDAPDVHPYLERARQELHAVDVNIREQLYAVAISRSYYAMFYAASGMLASIGIARSKHSGVLSAFRQHFIKTNLIEPIYSDYLGVGLDSRQESDYDLIPIIDAEFAAKRYEDARKFVERIESYLKQAGVI